MGYISNQYAILYVGNYLSFLNRIKLWYIVSIKNQKLFLSKNVQHFYEQTVPKNVKIVMQIGFFCNFNVSMIFNKNGVINKQYKYE